MKTGTITFTDAAKKKAPLKLANCTSLAAADTFADAVKKYTAAKPNRRSFSDSSVKKDVPLNEGDDSMIEAKMVIQYTDDKGQTSQTQFPGPLASNFEYKDGIGYRVKDSVGQSICSALGTATGRSLTFVKGWLIGARSAQKVG